jgi:hypothetical protein
VLPKHVENFIPKVFFAHKMRLPLVRKGKDFEQLMTQIEVENDVEQVFGKTERYTGANYEKELGDWKKKNAEKKGKASASKRKKGEETEEGEEEEEEEKPKKKAKKKS